MRKYKVTAEVDSSKFGKGQLVAHLTHDQFVNYANLSDNEKLKFLKDNDAEFIVEANELEDSDIKNFKVISPQDSDSDSDETQVTRKMRMNINGRDTGWVDVTEDNEEQYNQMLDQFNEMRNRFDEMNRRFDERFSRFFNFTPSSLLGFPSDLLRLDSQSKDENKETENENKDNKEEENNKS